MTPCAAKPACTPWKGWPSRSPAKPYQLKAEFRCVTPRLTMKRDVEMLCALLQQLEEAVANIEHYQTVYFE